MLTDEFVEQQRVWLLARKKSKTKILAEGGPRAALHSPVDIKRIDFALKRIEQKQYGLCTDCGVLIKTERLNFMPEIPFCVECQSDHDKATTTH